MPTNQNPRFAASGVRGVELLGVIEMRGELHFLDLSLDSPAANLALDEALLDCCESGDGPAGGVLRCWETPAYFVVVGYGNRSATEVDEAACREAGVGIFRRCSGGGTVLQGPGCLNYALVLPIEETSSLASITGANEFIMRRNRDAVAALVDQEVSVAGHTDLTLAGRKFSGNSQRRRRRFLLFHGTFLLNFDLDLVGRALRLPSREPAYREGRRHTDFLTNLPAGGVELRAALRRVWSASLDLVDPPLELARELAASRYATDGWNFRL